MRFQNTTLALASGALLALLWGATPAAAQSKAKAKTARPAPATKPTESSATTPVGGEQLDKVDISDLENKYWAPKDTDFSVVQNRTYSKDGRFALALQGGMLVNDGHSEGFTYGATANYFFSERYGIEATYTAADLKNNDPTDQLRNFGGGVQPDFGRMKDYYGVGFNWVPFYAKMSVLGKKIVYFDMAFTPAVGMMQYDQIVENGTIGKSALAYGVDVTQYFFLSNNFSIRLDLRNRWFKEDVAKYYTGGGLQKGQTFRTKNTQNTQFLLGINFFF